MRLSSPSIVVAAAGLAALTLAGCGHGSSSAQPTRVLTAAATGIDSPTVNVAGHGKVEGTPDTVTVTLGVSTRDAKAQGALDRNNSEASSLVDTLKQHGVAAKDIQTTDLSIFPDYDLKGRVTGYRASNTVTVRMHDIKNAGATIDAAAGAVGDDVRLNGVSFSIDDTSALVAKARANAVKDALEQARQLADAAGVKLGAIRTIDNTNTIVPEPRSYPAAGDVAAEKAITPIEAGTQQLSVDVKVVFDLG